MIYYQSIMAYSRKDQIAVRDRYLELMESESTTASAAKAAAVVGCSKTTAQRWLKKEGVLRSQQEATQDMWENKHGDEWERYATYLRLGYTITEVAERFDVSRKTVETAAKREGVDTSYATRRHRRCWDPNTPSGQERQKKVRKMAEKIHRGANKQDVAEEFDVSHRHLNVLLRSPLNPYNNVTYSPNQDYS